MERYHLAIVLLCTLCASDAFGTLPSLLSTKKDGPYETSLLCDELPGERTLTFYFFNLINPEEFQDGTRVNKASFREEVPLVYKVNSSKTECSMNFADMSINFEEDSNWELQGENPTRLVSTANVQFLRLGQLVCPALCCFDCSKTMSAIMVYQGNESYIRQDVTIEDVLMKGVNTTTFHYQMKYPHKCNFINLPLPELRTDSYAIYPGLQHPKAFTLSSDPDNFGKIMKLDGKTRLSWWESETSPEICSEIKGTDGSRFYGEVTKASLLHFYSEDLGIVVTLQFKEEDNSTGLPAFKFVFVDNMLDSSSCFCPEPGTGRENCLKTGAIDAKFYQNGLPYIMSYPHFYQADPSYLANVDGLQPDAESHESYFIIEPVTKTLIESSQKFQLNVDLKALPFESPDVLKVSVRDTVFPVYWTEKKFKLGSAHIESIKSYLESLGKSTTASAEDTTTTISADTTTTVKTTAATTTTAPPKPCNNKNCSDIQLGIKLEMIDLQIKLLGSMLLAIAVLVTLLLAAALFSKLYGSQRNAAQRSIPPSFGDHYYEKQ